MKEKKKRKYYNNGTKLSLSVLLHPVNGESKKENITIMVLN